MKIESKSRKIGQFFPQFHSSASRPLGENVCVAHYANYSPHSTSTGEPQNHNFHSFLIHCNNSWTNGTAHLNQVECYEDKQ